MSPPIAGAGLIFAGVRRFPGVAYAKGLRGTLLPGNTGHRLHRALQARGDVSGRLAKTKSNTAISRTRIQIMWLLAGFLTATPFYWQQTVPLFGIVAASVLLTQISPRMSSKAKVWFFGFVLLILISLPVGLYFRVAAPSLTSNFKTAYYLVFFLAGASALREVRKIESFLLGVELNALLASLFLLHLFHDHGILTLEKIHTGREVGRPALGAIFGDNHAYLWPTGFSLICVSSILFALYRLTGTSTRRSRSEFAYHAACLVIGMAILYTTGTRAGWVMLLCGVSYQVWKDVRYRFYVPILLFVAIAVSTWLGFSAIVGEHIQSRVNQGHSSSLISQLNERSEQWPVILGMLADSPLLGYGGVGIAHFPVKIGNAESQWLDITFRFGFVGVLLFTCFVISTIRSTNSRRPTPLEALLVGICLSSWVFGLTHLSIQDPAFGALYYTISGYLLGTTECSQGLMSQMEFVR